MNRCATSAGVLAGLLLIVLPAESAVVVVENRTEEAIGFTIRQPNGSETRHWLTSGALEPIATTGPVRISFEAGQIQRRYQLPPNTIQYFAARGGATDLFAQPLAAVARAAPRQQAGATPAKPAADDVFVVPVMILADDAEPAVRKVWEKRLRSRVAAASEIFERYCRVRFDVIAVDTWKSDPTARDFEASVAEFEREVNPAPARLAIGFTGRYQYSPDEKHVGGIRGPFWPHILIREALRRISEPERLEVLVHELGHYVGAAHSAESTSVMRPKLGDRQAVARRFRIGFDATNTLAMYLIAEELRRGTVTGLFQLPAETKNVLRSAYASLAEALPKDPAAPQYLMMLDTPVR